MQNFDEKFVMFVFDIESTS